ncbi:hypothetical protein Tco_1409260 [Tanacetum coccineum]
MFKLDLEPLALRLLQNREAHIDYLKYTQEQADILWEILKQAKAKQPLDNELDFSCKHAQRIQELLVYVRDTCLNAIKLSAKKVGNKKNDKISRTPIRNMKNKVEDQPRKVNKKNNIVEPIRDVDVKHSLLKANSKLICAACKKSMFDGVHDMCLLDFVGNMNSRAKLIRYKNLFYLKKAQRIKPTLYDGIVISAKHVAMPVIDDKETLILEEEIRSKMYKKEKSEAIKQNISHKPIDYENLNKLSEEFGKHFTPQQELSAEQAFWLLVKITTTPDARTEGEWGFEHTKAVFNNEIIPFLKSLKVIFNVFDKDLLNEIMEVHIVFDQIDATVQQSSVDKQCSEIAKKELFLENDRLSKNHVSRCSSDCNEFYVFECSAIRQRHYHLNQKCGTGKSVVKLLSENERLCKEINHVKQVFKDRFDSIKRTRVRTKERSDSLIDKLNLKSAKNEDLKAQIQDKVFVITSLKNDLRKLKGKEIIDIAAQISSANTIVPGMFKLDLEPLAPRLLQNREAHIDYLKYTQEQVDILWEIVEQAKAKQPLDNDLDFACKHAQRIQELLVYVQDTCPNAIKLSAKKVELSKSSNSDTPVLSPTGLKCSTSNCESKPTGNKKNDRISQKPSRNMKNKVEAQPRKVNKKNRGVEPIRDVDVKHSLLNANF